MLRVFVGLSCGATHDPQTPCLGVILLESFAVHIGFIASFGFEIPKSHHMPRSKGGRPHGASGARKIGERTIFLGDWANFPVFSLLWQSWGTLYQPHCLGKGHSLEQHFRLHMLEFEFSFPSPT